MNIMDFVESIKLQLSDLERVGEPRPEEFSRASSFTCFAEGKETRKSKTIVVKAEEKR